MIAVALGDVCSITMGQAPPGESYNTKGNGLPLVAGAGDFADGVVRAKKFTSAPSKVCRPGDILMSIRASIGAKVWADQKYCLGRGVAGLRPQEQLDARYLWHWLSNNEASLRAKGRGATFLQINRNDIAETPVNLPPLGEQRRIAAILDRADRLVSVGQKAASRRADLSTALFQSMFSGQTWTGRSLGDLLDFLTSGSRGWAKHYTDSGQLFLRIQNVKHGRLDLTDIAFVDVPESAEARRVRVQPGDVILSITADLGRVAVIPSSIETAYVNQHLSILRSSAVSPDFLAAYLASPAGQAQIHKRNRGGVKAGLNFDDIRSFEIPLPPRALQNAFSQRLARVESQGQELAERAALLREMRVRLRARAFSGQL